MIKTSDVASVMRAPPSRYAHSSWSCLSRPPTNLSATAGFCPTKLVDGRTKSDHDGGVRWRVASQIPFMLPRRDGVVELVHLGLFRIGIEGQIAGIDIIRQDLCLAQLVDGLVPA